MLLMPENRGRSSSEKTSRVVSHVFREHPRLLKNTPLLLPVVDSSSKTPVSGP